MKEEGLWLKKVEKKVLRKAELKNADLILSEAPWLAIDCESTGVYPYKSDKLFSIAVATETHSFYFNFIPYPNIDPELVLELQDFKSLNFINQIKVWILHNAKFDLSLLKREGISLNGIIEDTMVLERLIKNDELKYSLEVVAKKYGFEKSKAVEEYVSEEHLWEWEEIPGKKNRKKKLFYNLVPFPIISEYAMNDAIITYGIYKKQIDKLEELETRYNDNFSIFEIKRLENELTKIVFHIEQIGVQIDRGYCDVKIRDNLLRASAFASTYQGLTGLAFVDSNKRHAEAFDREACAYPKTEKGNPSFTDSALRATLLTGHGRAAQIAEAILGFRECSKRASTFFSSFIHYADSEGVVHPNLKQAGTASGRFSCTDPNLQQVPKADDSDDDSREVKRAFVPRDGFCFVELDYNALEYRLMLDYAGQQDLIAKVKSGMDVHQATADLVGISRQQAKTLNFAILYGAGKDRIAEMLKISPEQAHNFKQKYFQALPKVEEFINKVIHKAKTRGWIFNWTGRKYSFGNEFCYKAPNYLIQGSGADVCKVAMISLHKFLHMYRSRMILQVHDSVLFEVHKEELHIVRDLKEIMEKAYPYKHLPLVCSVEHSWRSWGDLTKGAPKIELKNVEGTGVCIQREGDSSPSNIA